ncbi:MAG: LysM peptidoglycan-binding domain-containing protein [Candidatus Hydrogenedens sp.]|nr:LysM peptidoglycan-binding domain-containing protein [Candidatus Hydrogenedens sp.]
MSNPPEHIAPTPPPPKPRSRTGTLVITFLLGMGVGFALHEAYIELLGKNQAPEAGAAAETEPAEPTEPLAYPETPADELADLNGLWPARHLFVGIEYGPLSDETIEMLGAFRPGGVVVTPQPSVPAAEYKAWIASIKRAAGGTPEPGSPPIIVGLGSAGLVNPWADNAPLTFALLGGEGEEALTDAGMEAGAEARAHGIEVMLAPPLLPLDKTRTAAGLRDAALGLDAEGVGQRGAAYCAGIEAEGLLPVAWGYPWLNIAAEDGALWRVAETDLRVLSTLLLPFSTEAGFNAPGILVHHVAAPGYETNFPDRPATMSPRLVQAFLRDKRGFGGVILCDDISALAEQRGEPIEESFAQALGAGCDAVLLAGADRTTLRRICAATIAMVGAGGLDADVLAASKTRLDAWQVRLADFAMRAQSPRPAPQPEGTDILRYEVREGDTLLAIAVRNNVSVADIKDWNGLYRSQVSPGAKLNIYLPEGTVPEVEEAPPAETPEAPAEEASTDAVPEAPATEEAAPEAPDAEAMPEETPPAAAEGEVTADTPAPVAPAEEAAPPDDADKAEGDTAAEGADTLDTAPAEVEDAPETPEAAPEAPVFKDASRPQTTYIVGQGDNLHRIALEHKTTTEFLVHLNNLKDANHVFLGQKLKVPEKPE